MVGGAVTRLTATTEPDMKLSLHTTLQKTGSCHAYPSTALSVNLSRRIAKDIGS